MHIEERLASIDETLKLILSALQSGAQVQGTVLGAYVGAAAIELATTQPAAQEGTHAPESAPKSRRGRPPKEAASESAPTQAADAPSSPTATVVVEAAAPVKTVAESAPPAAPVAPAPQASTAAQASAPSDEPTWDEAVNVLRAMAKDQGAAAVSKLIKRINPNAANVNAIKDKVSNAELIAMVNAEMNPKTDDDALLFG